MTTSAVSVVIPVFDGERFLAEALEGVVMQTRAADVDLQVVVVDDGSTDGSVAVAQRFAGGGPVEIVTHPDNRGVGAARATGLRHCRHDLVAFCDQDDVWTPDKLAVQLAALDAHRCDLALGHVEHFVEAGLERPAWFRPRWGASAVPGWLLGAALVRREVFDRFGDFDPSRRHGNDDVEWFARVTARGVTTHMCDEVVLRRRVHDRNLSRMTRAGNAELLDLMRSAAAARRAAGQGERIEP